MEEKRAPRIPLTRVEPAIRGIADEPLLLLPLLLPPRLPAYGNRNAKRRCGEGAVLNYETKEMVRMERIGGGSANCRIKIIFAEEGFFLFENGWKKMEIFPSDRELVRVKYA